MFPKKKFLAFPFFLVSLNLLCIFFFLCASFGEQKFEIQIKQNNKCLGNNGFIFQSPNEKVVHQKLREEKKSKWIRKLIH